MVEEETGEFTEHCSYAWGKKNKKKNNKLQIVQKKVVFVSKVLKNEFVCSKRTFKPHSTAVLKPVNCSGKWEILVLWDSLFTQATTVKTEAWHARPRGGGRWGGAGGDSCCVEAKPKLELLLHPMPCTPQSIIHSWMTPFGFLPAGTAPPPSSTAPAPNAISSYAAGEDPSATFSPSQILLQLRLDL